MKTKKLRWGMGSITRRKDGRFHAAIELGRDPLTGARKRKNLYATSQAEIVRLVNEANAAKAAGLPLRSQSPTLDQYIIDRWLPAIKPNVRPATYARFEQLLRVHILPNLGRWRLEKLPPDIVQRFLNFKVECGCAPRSVRQMRAVLVLALNQAMRWNLLARNVAAIARGPKCERQDITTIPEDQARRFLDSLIPHRLHALYVMALALGCRRGELLGARWDDVDLERKEFTVKQSLQRSQGKLRLLPLKTASSSRTLNLPAYVVDALTRHRARQAAERLSEGPDWRNSLGLVFTTSIGSPLEPRNVNRQFHALLLAAGLEKVRFHDLRHSCATILLENGADIVEIQHLLGHSTPATTMGIYLHSTPSSRARVAARMDDILAGPVKAKI